MSVAPLALDDPAARDPAVVGVKAAGLAAAAVAGLPVLPGWVLPVEASAAAIAAGARALARGEPSSAYLAAMETVVPAGLDAPIPLRPSGPEPGEEPRPIDELWVVRSSTERDGDGRWAGTFTSYLGIEAGDLPTAVRGCWASAFSGDALGRCDEAGVDVDTLRVGVLVQPFLRLDFGGTARVRADGAIDVALAPGGPAGVVGGRPGGRDLTVGADGRIVGEPGEGTMAETASSAARLARRAADTVAASAIEWGAVGDDLYLLQISQARRHEAPSSEQPPPRLAAPRVPVPAGAERVARLVTAFAGPLAEELVDPVGARHPRGRAPGGDPRSPEQHGRTHVGDRRGPSAGRRRDR